MLTGEVGKYWLFTQSFTNMCSVKCLRRVLLWCLLSNWISGKDLVASTVASSLCLPSGLNPEFRKNLSKAGESYPVGVVLADWSSAHVTSAVFEILIEEVLGYNIYVDPRSPASTLDGIYALIGCTTFMNAVDRGCTDRNAKLHMMSESWWQYYAGYYALAEEFHGEIPIEAGGMGYTGSDGVYVPKAILVEAENETGLALEYYKSYHPQWFKPWVYFGNVSDVDTSMVLPCHLVGHFTHNASTFVYWSKTGDDGGVTIVNNSYKVFCADGFFWRAAACRSSPWKCILFITAGDGWGARAVMDKATFLSMPLAIAVANSAVNYVTIPHFYKSLIYWWTPDATFMDLNPTKLVFPPYNAYEWNERQVYTTAGEETPLSKLISHDLEFLAPDIVKLLGSGTFDINAVNSMMAEQKGSGLSRKKVACNWLKANEERWRPWIPVETACSLGFGLYDETKDRFATLRAGATTCRACLPGTYSMKIVDSVGVTYVCEACPPGQQQRGAGAVVCEPCPLGTSKGYQSIENCAPCQAGKYQDQEGTLMCKDCPNSTTTVLLGVTMLSDCVCKEGTMDVNDAGQSTFAVSKECVECTEGIRCPDGATLKGLQVGQNVTGFSGPAILEGYFSWSKEPLSIYKCPEPFCPGGRPGTCQGGRLGPTCSECAAGMYWANDQCTVCEVPLKVTWFVAIVAAFVLMIAAYYGTDPRYRARATVKECMSIGTDLMLAFVQNLGILSAVQVPWPGELRVLFEFSSIFVLNLKAMGFNCASHGDMQQYVLCAGVFLAVTGTLPTLGALSHFLPSLKRRDLSWNFYKTICVTGKFLQSGFTTLCNIGMVPFMCFLHPNGTHSILKYPNTFCNSSEHWAMQIGGTVVLLLAMTHFIVCAWACHQAPVWSRSTPHRLVGIGFLLANYRPSTWWFGLTLLIRGPLLSFPAVVATNSPGINLTMMFFVLQISFALQLYFLPWKAPILNIVDATATSLFLMLLAISLHLEDANRSLVVLELVGVGVYYVSIGVIACVWFVSLALLAWQRCFAARREPKIVNLGALPDANDVLSAIELVTMSLAQKTDKQKEFLLKKMSFEISAYDLRIVGQALDILFDDCELRPVSQSAAGATARLAAKRMSQMTRRSITYLRPSLQKELEEEAQEVHADTRIVGAAGALEEQPEGVDAEVEVRQVHSFNSSISSFRDDAL